MAGKLLGAIYNALIWAGLVTMLCVRSVVICMNINMGTLLVASAVVFSVILGIISFVKNHALGAKFSLCNLGLSALILIVVYRFIYHQDLLPKIIFTVKLALHKQIVSAGFVYGVITAVMVVGYLMVLLVSLHRNDGLDTKK